MKEAPPRLCHSPKLLAMCLFFFIFHALLATAQEVAVKTNMLYWLTTTPNVAAEFALAPKLTLNLSVGYNAWNLFPHDMSVRTSRFASQWMAVVSTFSLSRWATGMIMNIIFQARITRMEIAALLEAANMLHRLGLSKKSHYPINLSS